MMGKGFLWLDQHDLGESVVRPRGLGSRVAAANDKNAFRFNPLKCLQGPDLFLALSTSRAVENRREIFRLMFFII